MSKGALGESRNGLSLASMTNGGFSLTWRSRSVVERFSDLTRRHLSKCMRI